MDYICYQGIDYPVRYVLIHEIDEYRTIASESLRDEVYEDVDGHLGYASPEAQAVDELIYAYVEDDILNNYSNEKLERYVNDNC